MPAEGSITLESDIDIVNSALTQLGSSPISAFGQNSGNALILQTSYNRSRDDLLRSQPWNFARKFVSLSMLNLAPVNLDFMPETSGSPGLVSFTSAFQLPNDCLRVFRFSPKDAHWRIVGQAIYTDAVPPVPVGPLLGEQTPTTSGNDNIPSATAFGAQISLGIEYIQQVTNPADWDPSFEQCFVMKLAKEMALSITGLTAAYNIAKNEYDEALKNAATINGLENWPDEFWNTDLTTPRYGYVGVTIEGY